VLLFQDYVLVPLHLRNVYAQGHDFPKYQPARMVEPEDLHRESVVPIITNKENTKRRVVVYFM